MHPIRVKAELERPSEEERRQWIDLFDSTGGGESMAPALGVPEEMLGGTSREGFRAGREFRRVAIRLL